MRRTASPVFRILECLLLICCAALITGIFLLSLFPGLPKRVFPDSRDRRKQAVVPASQPMKLQLSYAGGDLQSGSSVASNDMHRGLPGLQADAIKPPPEWRIKGMQLYKDKALLDVRVNDEGSDRYLLADDIVSEIQAASPPWQNGLNKRRSRGIMRIVGISNAEYVIICNEITKHILPHDTHILGASISERGYAYLIRFNEQFYVVSGPSAQPQAKYSSWVDLTSFFNGAVPGRELLRPDIHYARPSNEEERKIQELGWLDVAYNRSIVTISHDRVVIYNWPRDLLILMDGAKFYTTYPEMDIRGVAELLHGKPYVPQTCFSTCEDSLYVGFTTGETFKRILIVRLNMQTTPGAAQVEPLGFIACAAKDPRDTVQLLAQPKSLLLFHEPWPDQYPAKNQLFQVMLPNR